MFNIMYVHNVHDDIVVRKAVDILIKYQNKY